MHTTKPVSASTIPILPVDVPGTPHRLARGVRAGRWLFATGQCGTDYMHGMATDVLQAGHPFDGPSKSHREARRIFQNIAEVLAAGGSSPESVVRIDQYYTSPNVVDGYHETRRAFFNGRIPPSTSNIHRRFARTGQTMEVQAMAAVPGTGFEVAARGWRELVQDPRELRLQPGAQRRRLPLRARTNGGGAEGRGPAGRSRGAADAWIVEGHADQARDRLHHQAAS